MDRESTIQAVRTTIATPLFLLSILFSNLGILTRIFCIQVGKDESVYDHPRQISIDNSDVIYADILLAIVGGVVAVFVADMAIGIDVIVYQVLMVFWTLFGIFVVANNFE